MVERGAVRELFQQSADALSAAGLIVWLADDSGEALRPGLVHGYSDKVLAQLPAVTRDADNATAAAFRTARPCEVAATAHTSGALVVPLLIPDGCAGVLAIELQQGVRTSRSLRAVAVFVAAALTQLVHRSRPAERPAPVERPAPLGVGRTFQITATFGSMTVLENIQMVLLSHHRRLFDFWGRAARRHIAEGMALLERVGMASQADRTCGVLAYGDLKRVELAMALASEPCLLLMDEPTAGMAPRERIELMALTAELVRERNIAVLFTEHDMDVVFTHADRIIVLNRGELIASGPPADVRADRRVQELTWAVGRCSTTSRRVKRYERCHSERRRAEQLLRAGAYPLRRDVGGPPG